MAIRVEPVSLAWIDALIAGDDVFADRFGIPVVEGWAGFPEALPHVRATALKHDCDPWGSQLFFDDDGSLVGFGGYKGVPIDNTVEIGYAIAPQRQRRGLATAAAHTMIERARLAGVTTVLAHTLAERNASTAVLTRCGFVHLATVPDPDGDVSGDVWRWILDLPPSRT